MGDILFSSIEKLHGNRLWGKLLDAGTGVHSLKWVQGLTTTSWTAITADYHMKTQIQLDPSISSKLRSVDRVLVGNWMDEKFCQTIGQYDTILADYLIGAVDGFSPYEQDTIVKKLANHLLPNGRLYFIGMSPIPDEQHPPASVISEIRRARDSCILLAGHRPYREFPLSWMKRHIEAAGLAIINTRNFTILHSEDSALRQIKVARSKLDYFVNLALQDGMRQYLLDLEERTRKTVRANGGKIPLSYDYVIAAEKVDNVLEFNNAGKSSTEVRVIEDDYDHDHDHDQNHSHEEDIEIGNVTILDGNLNHREQHHE